MRRAVMTVGRMNPPTLGHEVLIKQVLAEAKRLNAQPILFLVDGELSSKDKAKNPLTGQERARILRSLYPELKVELVNDAFNAVEVLYIMGMEPTLWVAGSDRAPNYRKLLEAAGFEGQVVEVDREAGEADGVSATAARQAARSGDWKSFRILMPRRASDTLLNDIMLMIQESNQDGQGSKSSILLPQ